MARATFFDVQRYLAGMDYPATRDRLIQHARDNNADEQALRALQSIPDDSYSGPDAVSKAIADS